MGPITNSLCHTPIIGVVMWITSLCAFPPPLPSRDISLDEPGLVLSATFEAPLDQGYPLILSFTFPTVDARLSDTFVGSTYADECRGTIKYEDIPEKRRIGLGEPVPFRVIVKNSKNSQIVFDDTLTSLCTSSHNEKGKDRRIGYIPLKRGTYNIDIINLAAQPKIKGIKTEIKLSGGMGKG